MWQKLKTFLTPPQDAKPRTILPKGEYILGNPTLFVGSSGSAWLQYEILSGSRRGSTLCVPIARGIVTRLKKDV